jgi:hypothetical protein
VTLALEELGYPTVHMLHMYEYENEEILRMLDEKIVSPAIEKKQVAVGKADLALIANSGYQAVTDLPFIFFHQQIHEEYPDCKFILTTRETSEIWYWSWESMTNSLSKKAHIAGFFLPKFRTLSKYMRWMTAVVNNDVSYLTSKTPIHTNVKENAIATYEAHNRRVREIIPANQLLEFNVREGWEPLCAFLEITDCPTTPFPKTNSAKQMQAQSASAFVFGGMVLIILLKMIRKVALPQRKLKVE